MTVGKSQMPGDIVASESGADRQAIIDQLLIETLDKSHPVVAEGIMMAAVPSSFDLPLLTGLRRRDDGNDERLYRLLASLPYVEEQRLDYGRRTKYAVRPLERQSLQSQFIKRDRAGFLETHRRALAHWQGDLSVDHFVQTQNVIYHRLIVDSQEEDARQRAGIAALIRTFREYINDRHLAATDRLLQMAESASLTLKALGAEWTVQLEQLVMLLRARLAQFQGHWDESRRGLERLRRQSNLWPPIVPYLARVYGHDLAHGNDFAGAVVQYEAALGAFRQAAENQDDRSLARATTAEIGLTMIALGDAHLELARSVRGRSEVSGRARQAPGGLAAILDYLRALPVLIYLSFFFGRQVWDRAIVAVMGDEDWIIIRLLATAVRYYLRSEPYLEGDRETRSDRALADERLAYLLLEIGAAEQAAGIFAELLEEKFAAISPYRRARAQAGLAEAYLQLGQPEEAVAPLQAAIDELKQYAVEPLAPRARQALGEAYFELGQLPQSVQEYAAAIQGFQEQENWTAATSAAERLRALTEQQDLPAPVQGQAAVAVEGLDCRQYQIRFQHPRLRRFRHLVLLLLPLLIILIPLLTIRLDTSTHIAPTITFQAAPILNLDQVGSSALVEVRGQAVRAANIAEPPDPELLLWVGIILFAGYLFLSLLFGVLAIVSTPLRTVQNLGRQGTIHLDDEGIGTRQAGHAQWLEWPSLRRLVFGDALFKAGVIGDHSSFTLLSDQERLEVPSATDWYRSLRRTVEQHLPAAGRRVDLDYDLWRSRAGLLYLANLALLGLVAILVVIAPQAIWQDLPGLRYSIGDLYPFLYIGLFIVPLWWGVIRRLRVRRHMKPRTRFTWWVLGAGLFGLALQLVLGFRPLLTPVNVIIPLATLLLLISAAAAVWQAERAGQEVYPPWLRSAVLVAVVAGSLLMLVAITGDVQAYHNRVMGDYYRDQIEAAEAQDRRELAAQALAHYQDAVAQGSAKIPRLDPPWWTRQIPGAPRMAQLSVVSGLLGQAAMQMQLQQYQEAVRTYTEILDWTNLSGQVFAWRAQAHQGLADVARLEGQEEAGVVHDEVIYDEVIYDYDRAMGIRPRAEYALGRAVAQNTRGDVEGALASYEQALKPAEETVPLTDEQRAQARIGQAWLWHDAERYAEALQAFSEATQANPRSVEAWLGLGYAQYALERFGEALISWEEARQLDPKEPMVPISLGTLYWKLGGLSWGAGEQEAACQSYGRSVELFTQAADEEGELEPQSDDERAFTYRTLGQVYFLYDRCTDHPTEALAAAVDSYTRAVELDPDNAIYWQMRGRLNYALWSVDLETGPGARARLFAALDDLEKAIALQPDDDPAIGYEPNRWREDRVQPAAIGGTRLQARDRFDAGQYQEALGYYELLANEVQQNADYAFMAGLSALASGDETTALNWYEAGINRALAQDEAGAIRRAWTELNDYLEGSAEAASSDRVASLLQESGVSLASAEELVTQALSAYEAGQEEDALATYRQGLARAAEDGDVGAAWAGQLSFYERSDPEFMVDLNELVADAWPDLASSAADDEAVREAFDLALMAALRGDGDAAGQWFNEGIRRTRGADFNPILRQVGRFEMRDLWQLAGDLDRPIDDDFISAMDAQLPALLADHPALQDDGEFWRYRGWFKYYIGLAVFHAGDETFARAALESGLPDATRAGELGAGGSFAIQTYLPEAAWGWYHIERGDALYDEGDYESALEYYEKAAEFIKPDQNATAYEEATLAAFRAARTAVALADFELALTWYEEGLARAAAADDEQGLISGALAALNDLLAEMPALAEEAEPLQAMLEAEAG